MDQIHKVLRLTRFSDRAAAGPLSDADTGVEVRSRDADDSMATTSASRQLTSKPMETEIDTSRVLDKWERPLHSEKCALFRRVIGSLKIRYESIFVLLTGA